VPVLPTAPRPQRATCRRWFFVGRALTESYRRSSKPDGRSTALRLESASQPVVASVPHLGETFVPQAFPCPQQSPRVGSLGVAIASAAIPQMPGDRRTLVSALLARRTRWKWSTARMACGSAWRSAVAKEEGGSIATCREIGGCARAASRPRWLRCGPRIARAAPDRQPSRRTQCPTGRSETTAQTRRTSRVRKTRGPLTAPTRLLTAKSHLPNQDRGAVSVGCASRCGGVAVVAGNDLMARPA